MRSFSILLILTFLAVTKDCGAQSNVHRETYSWLSSQTVPKAAKDQFAEKPRWIAPRHLKSTADTFVVYGNSDSIRMISSSDPGGKLFKKKEIKSAKWKPRSDYGKQMFFLGTYEREGLTGIYTSIYATKDWHSLMQLHYLDSGYLLGVLLFSRDAVNVLKKNKVFVDPKD